MKMFSLINEPFVFFQVLYVIRRLRTDECAQYYIHVLYTRIHKDTKEFRLDFFNIGLFHFFHKRLQVAVSLRLFNLCHRIVCGAEC